MTDPKPATPATDEDINDLKGHSCYDAGCPSDACYNGAWIPDLIARIAADAEIIKAARQERDAVKEALVEARETIRKQAEEIESQKHQLEANHEWEAKQADEIERLKGAYKIMGTRFSALATAREQVRTLREALKAALGHCDCSDYNSRALIPCTEAHPCAGCRTTRTGQAALAATEPKG